MLKVEHVTKQFGGLTAVNDVSFEVSKGELVGLIGPNGSGKTTLISLISGTLSPTNGSIKYHGTEIEKLPPYQRARMGISRTFQVVKPLQNLSVRDNIMTAASFGGQKISGVDEIMGCLSTKRFQNAYDRTSEILEMVGLSDKADIFARNLTLPGHKRLEVARALAMNPDIILLDEVMAGLNLKEVEEAMALVKEINNQGVTVIMIEHIMKVIMGVSHRILVMNQGSLICQGTPEEVANDPRVIGAYLGARFVGENDEEAGA